MGVVVILGVAFGVVLALAAGARRADSAVDRFLDASSAYDVIVVQGVPGIFDFAPLDLDEVAALPGIEQATPRTTFAASGTTSDGIQVDSSKINFNAHPDGAYGTEINRYRVLEGRLADPADPNELVVPFRSAEVFDLDVGDTIAVNFLAREELGPLFDPTAPDPTTLEELALDPTEELRVVGVVAVAGELAPASRGTDIENVELTPAADEAFHESAIVHSLVIRLEDGAAGVPEFISEVERLGGDQPVLVLTQADATRAAEQAIRPIVRALWVAAGLLLVVILLIGGQVLARQAASEGSDDPALRALGLSGRQAFALRVAKATVVALPTALVAVGIAVALSPLFPVGLAGTAEPDPGLSVDGTVLALGLALVFVALAALAGGAGWWHSRRRGVRARGRASTLLGAVGRTGAPPAAVAGCRMALMPGRTSAATLWTSAATVALGLATVTGVGVFVASLDHLRDSPTLYGWNWDATLGHDFAATIGDEQLEVLRSDEAVSALSVGDDVTLDLDGQDVVVVGVDPVVGAIAPRLIEGRAPESVGEIVVRPSVAEVGETVQATFGETTTELQVVGQAALPRFDAFTSFETLRRLTPEAARQVALVRFAPGADGEDYLAQLHHPPVLYTDEDIEQPALSEDLVNFGRVDQLPVVVGGLMALVAAATLVHALLLTARSHRRDLAVLKSVGFTRRQVVATVGWQATALAVVAALLAVPAGIVVGRWGWLLFAEEVGVVPVAVVPLLAVAVVAIAAVLLANAVALAPAWRAARTPPGEALRAE
jgi:putative ABC transport system permease protein